MRVDRRLFPGVVFVGPESNGVFTPTGTALVAGVQYRGIACPFLVTAQHLVNEIPGASFSIRINRKVGDCTTIRIPKTPNLAAPQAEHDIGVFPLNMSLEIFDHSLTRLDRGEWNALIEKIGRHDVGDEVATIGLYTTHHGTIRNRPVVRIGNIAAMPEEPVSTVSGFVEGYLIETRSLLGLSGSPVFVGIPPVRGRGSNIEFVQADARFYILGIMIGYHRVESKSDQIIVPRFGGPGAAPPSRPFDPEAAPDELNTGFGVVVPIERVFDILEREDVMAVIKEAVEDFFKNSGFRPASADGIVGAVSYNEVESDETQE